MLPHTNCKLAKIQFTVRAIPFIFQNLYHYDNYQHAHVHMLIIDQIFTSGQPSPLLLYDGDISSWLPS